MIIKKTTTREEDYDYDSFRKKVSEWRKNGYFKVLDHGHVRFLDCMGNETDVVKSARISYGRDHFEDSKKDSRLRKRLLADKHTSPFEAPKLMLEIKCPIFVSRQWFRHRFCNYNEESLRYSVSKCEYYFPKREDVRKQSTTNKQGRGDPLPAHVVDGFLENLKEITKLGTDAYHKSLNGGIARELCRILLPANLYTRFIWCVDLKTLLHFLDLRVSTDAQYEIRVYAKCILENIVCRWVPDIYKYFNAYVLNTKGISETSRQIMKSTFKSKGLKLEDFIAVINAMSGLDEEEKSNKIREVERLFYEEEPY